MNVAQSQGTRSDTHSTDHGDGHVVEVAEKHHHGLDGSGHELGAVGRLEQILIGRRETSFHVGLLPEGLDDRVPREGLFDDSVHLAGLRPLGHELGP